MFSTISSIVRNHRFVSLAPINNKVKAKWIYAFNIVPGCKMDSKELTKQPEDTTENPYCDLRVDAVKQEKPDNNGQFFFNMSQAQPSDNNQRNRRQDKHRHHNQPDQEHNQSEQLPKKPKREKLDPIDCWFCLSSPKVEKHLLVSIGEQAYLAAAKGGLNDEHLLIIPVNHCRSTLECEDNELLDEINKFKKSLNSYFDARDKKVIYFERNFRSDHLQIQCVPIDNALVTQPRLNNTIKQMLGDRGLKYKELPDDVPLSEVVNPGTPYFFMELPTGKRILVFVQKGQFFPLQLGRELLASQTLLNCVDRIDWRTCQLSRDQYVQLIKKFREDFKSYDWTLEGAV